MNRVWESIGFLGKIKEPKEPFCCSLVPAYLGVRVDISDEGVEGPDGGPDSRGGPARMKDLW